MNTTTCPQCDRDNAFYNGVCWECPDCGYSWDDSVYKWDYRPIITLNESDDNY